ncbi:hypothetical protein [Tengunoibacter tsumagoiensis]|uniref:Photosynthesis system II assembly factor Ycf48/Hcf136-like domain-containing protein n=1 Tax=Tengunoibacter tsumagoiensis TaxID=2014871 RepID=A0A401ZVQ5_9CHLR|nr:hypothetical protein [Tengunoibacter tsumagoiensis]GCE10985.1 hypothetical protein KTT_08440 [Tengunoibacter tsumagoiensis]
MTNMNNSYKAWKKLLRIPGLLVMAQVLFLIQPASAAGVINPGWHIVSSANGAGNDQLLGVSAIATNDIWAVGNANNQPLIEHWDGSSWTIVPASDLWTYGSLAAVAAIDPANVWAVGRDGGGSVALLAHWDGTSWKQSRVSFTGNLFAITALAWNDIWAVGRDDDFATLIIHWDGTNWSRVASPSPGSVGSYLFGIAAHSASDIWAVGEDVKEDHLEYTLVEHWDGVSWNTVSDNQQNGSPVLNAVTTFPSGKAIVVGTYGPNSGYNDRVYAQLWNGAQWNTQPIPSPTSGVSALMGIVAPGENDAWAVGTNASLFRHPGAVVPLIEHWNGAGWRRMSGPRPGVMVALNAISLIPDSGQLVAVGSYQTTYNAPLQTIVEMYY